MKSIGLSEEEIQTYLDNAAADMILQLTNLKNSNASSAEKQAAVLHIFLCSLNSSLKSLLLENNRRIASQLEAPK